MTIACSATNLPRCACSSAVRYCIASALLSPSEFLTQPGQVIALIQRLELIIKFNAVGARSTRQIVIVAKAGL